MKMNLKLLLSRLKENSKFVAIQGLISVFVYELIEEALEEFIAFGLSEIVTFSLKAVFAVALTQGIKLVIKKIIKLLTYKKGDDKMDTFKKIGKFIRENWQTGLGIASFAYVIIESAMGLISTKLGAMGISPEFVHLIMSPLYGLIVNALAKQGLEFGSAFTERKEVESTVKMQKAIEKAKAKLLAEAEQAVVNANKPIVPTKLTKSEIKAQQQAEIKRLAQAELEQEKQTKVV